MRRVPEPCSFRVAAAMSLVATVLPAQPDPLAAARRSVGLVGTNPVHWRVTFHSDPAREAVVSWSTSEKGRRHRLYYDTISRGGRIKSYRYRQLAKRNGKFTQGSEAMKLRFYFHHVFLKRLNPSTTYYCAMVSDKKQSQEFHFRTGPADGRAFKLLFGGDSRTDHKVRVQVNEFLSKTLAANPDIVALVHGGDYVTTGDNLIEWGVWLTHHQRTTTAKGRILPIIPLRGNHEGPHPQFDEVFAWPGGPGVNYYEVLLGTEVLLLGLNTETVTAGDQLRFMRATLDRFKRRRWQLAAYHRPAYPAVKEPSHALVHWVPLFEEYRLDLVLEADGHVIKRTTPILAGRPHKDGVVYVGEGGLGVAQRDPKTDLWYFQPPGMVAKGHHVYLLSFSRDKLRSEVLRVDGQGVLDTWERKPRKR